MAAPTLKLANPTASERIRCAKGTFPQWGGGLSLDVYLEREVDSAGPLNRDGGLVPWILTEADAEPDSRPLLSSCDTLRKRAIVREKGSDAPRDVIAQGVASVFTPEDKRGKGYAGRMMGLLGEVLGARANEEEGEQQTLFSVLYSDVGKVFYARRGWKAMESSHFKFSVDASKDYPYPQGVKHIAHAEVAELTAIDERLLRQKFAALPKDSSRHAVAIIPDDDHMKWHFNRAEIMAKSIWPGGPIPDIHGAIVTVPSSSTRIWTVWTRKLRKADAATNTLCLLRFVVEEPEKVSDQELGDAVEKIVAAARNFGKENACAAVQWWNPDERVKRLVEEKKGLEAEHVVRESDSILSLNWFGEDSADEVDWIIPEQYTWC